MIYLTDTTDRWLYIDEYIDKYNIEMFSIPDIVIKNDDHTYRRCKICNKDMHEPEPPTEEYWAINEYEKYHNMDNGNRQRGSHVYYWLNHYKYNHIFELSVITRGDYPQ